MAKADVVLRIDRTTHAQTTLLQLPAGSSVLRVVADAAGVYATVKGSAGDERLVHVRAGGVDALASSTSFGAIALTAQWLYVATTEGIQRIAR